MIEADLAERLGVSRTPVRQALSQLEAQGIAARDARGGLVVTTLDYDQLSELYPVREMAEALAARLAARHASPSAIDLLREFVEADRGRTGQPQALIQSNSVFHAQLLSSARGSRRCGSHAWASYFSNRMTSGAPRITASSRTR